MFMVVFRANGHKKTRYESKNSSHAYLPVSRSNVIRCEFSALPGEVFVITEHIHGRHGVDHVICTKCKCPLLVRSMDTSQRIADWRACFLPQKAIQNTSLSVYGDMFFFTNNLRLLRLVYSFSFNITNR